MSKWERFKEWLAHLQGAVGLWAVLPQSVVALITAWLSGGVSWISQLGLFGMFASGLIGFAVASFGLAQASRWRLYRFEAKQRARITGESSAFDPMAPVYENKRLYLRDLAPMGRLQVAKKKFINCELIGPGVAILGMNSDPLKPALMRDCLTLDGVDCFEVVSDRRARQAIEFLDCDFDGCKFYHMSLLFFQRLNEDLHWITKDSRQAMLPQGPPTIKLEHKPNDQD